MDRLMIHQIYEYVDGSKNSRCLIEAEKILDANHLILIGITDSSSEHFDLFALCLQSSALSSTPHSITGKILKNASQQLEIGAFNCSCKAGPGGGCKHITAALIHCNRNPITSLDKVSSTDQECLWKKLKTSSLQNYKPVPFQDFCHVVPAPDFHIPDNLLESFKREMMEACPQSILSLHAAGKLRENEIDDIIPVDVQITEDWLTNILSRELDIKLPDMDLSPPDRIFFNSHVSVNLSDAITLAKDTVSQNNELWFQERKFRLTGSTCYGIFTYARNKRPDWEKKIYNTLLCNCFCGNSATKHGIMFEESAINEYSKLTNTTVLKTGLLINSVAPFLGFSPDGIVIHNGGLTLIEVKCPVAGKHSTATTVVQTLKYLHIKDGQYHLKEKHSYFGQVQLGLFLTGASECHMIIFSSFDNSFVNVVVKYNFNFVSTLILTLNKVYFENVLPAICRLVNK